MNKLLLVFSVCMCVAGCTSGPLVESPATLKTLKTVEQQQKALHKQSEQIESLLVTQTSLVSHLDEMQTKVQKVHEELQRHREVNQQQSKREAKSPVREIVERPKKPSLRHSGKAVLGRVEYLWLEGASDYLKARVDTGEKTSLLYVQNIQRFERDGDDWVRFEIQSAEDSVMPMEAPLLRELKLRIVGKDDVKRRPVVKLRLRLGELDEATDFVLSDQKDILYPVLLGRSFLQDIVIVDVGRKFTRKRDPILTGKSDS